MKRKIVIIISGLAVLGLLGASLVTDPVLAGSNGNNNNNEPKKGKQTQEATWGSIKAMYGDDHNGKGGN